MYTTKSATPRADENAFQADFVGFPQQLGSSEDLNEAHNSCCTSLDLLLQGLHRVCFHNCLCWLRLHLHLLAENVANASFCRWLHTGLDTAEAWQCENTILLDLRGCHGHQAVDHLRACCLLQLPC